MVKTPHGQVFKLEFLKAVSQINMCFPKAKNFVVCTNEGAAQPQEQIILISQSLHLLGFFPICNNIFPIIDQCRFFLYFWNRTWSITILINDLSDNLSTNAKLQNYLQTVPSCFLLWSWSFQTGSRSYIYPKSSKTKLPSIIS